MALRQSFGNNRSDQYIYFIKMNWLRYSLHLVIILTCWQPICRANDLDYFNVIEKLHETLLKNYNKQIRPVLNHTEALNIETGLELTNFNYDEQKARFSAAGYFQMIWKDPRLQWSPADYDGLESIHLPSTDVWLPDLEVYLAPGLLSRDRSFADNTQVLILSNGTVLFVPLCNLVSVCVSNPTLYPFDKVTCRMTIGSWTHNALKMNLKLRFNATKISIEDLESQKMSKWNLIDTDASIEVKTYDCCPGEPYQSLKYSFVLKRSLSTMSALTTPVVVIAILSLATFFIPPGLSAKLFVGVINLAMMCAYLLYFHVTLPSDNDSTPLIVSFYSTSLFVVIISIITTIFSLQSLRLSKSSPHPILIRYILESRLGRIFFISQSNPNLTNDLGKEKGTTQLDNLENSHHATQQWMNLFLAIDRIMFLIYFLVSIGIGLSYLCTV